MNTPTPLAGFKLITLKIRVRRGSNVLRNEEHVFAYPEQFATRWSSTEEHNFIASESETEWRKILNYTVSRYPGTLYWSEGGWTPVERVLAERERTPSPDSPETDMYAKDV